MKVRIFALSAVTACSMSAWSADLFVPFSLDSAGVLPKGVRSFRVTTFSSEIGEKFNNSGSPEALGAGFNKEVSYNDLVKGLPAGATRESFAASLEAHGIALDSA